MTSNRFIIHTFHLNTLKTEKILQFSVPNCNIFSVLCIFKCNPGKTNDKFIISMTSSLLLYILLYYCLLLLCNSKFIISMVSLLLLNNFYPVISYRYRFKRKRKRRIIVYDSVTRYGPRTSCQRGSKYRHDHFHRSSVDNQTR